MKFCVLASGSKGNTTYIEYKNTKMLIDAGISFQMAQQRAAEKGIDLKQVNVILITHEHSDHINGLPVYLKNTHATLYMHKDSFYQMSPKIFEKIKSYPISFIEENSRYKIGEVDVLTLKLSHDCASCLGFVIIGGPIRLGYVTDTGFFPVVYLNIMKTVHYLIIEANHDIEMLTESNRRWELKERILSTVGHMSNNICSQVLKSIVHKDLKLIILAHLSEECNHIDYIKRDIINEIVKDYHGKIVIASQYEALEMVEEPWK